MTLRYMISSIKRMLIVPVALCASLSAQAQSSAAAQETPTGQVVDKIIAKVDNNIILESDLQKAYLEALGRAQEGFATPSRCEVFESLLVNKMMVAKAEIDSVIVTEAK